MARYTAKRALGGSDKDAVWDLAALLRFDPAWLGHGVKGWGFTVDQLYHSYCLCMFLSYSGWKLNWQGSDLNERDTSDHG